MFFLENGQGRILDEGEEGRDAMDWEEEVDPHHLQTLTRPVLGSTSKSKVQSKSQTMKA